MDWFTRWKRDSVWPAGPEKDVIVTGCLVSENARVLCHHKGRQPGTQSAEWREGENPGPCWYHGPDPPILEPHHSWTFCYVKWFLTVHDHWVGGFLYLASEVILTDPAGHFGKLWEWVLPLKNKLPHQVPKWAYPSLFKYIISPATRTQAIPPCLADFVT